MATEYVYVQHTITGIKTTITRNIFEHPVLGQFYVAIGGDEPCDCGDEAVVEEEPTISFSDEDEDN